MSTSHERNVQIWSSTADSPSQRPARIAARGSAEASERHAGEAHTQLTSSARWNVVMLLGSGLASTAFFLAAVLTDSLYAGPSLIVKNPLSVTAPAPHVIFQPVAAVAPPVSSSRNTLKRRPVRKYEPDVASTQGPLKPPQSRLARLILGDGSHDVQPFPRPAER